MHSKKFRLLPTVLLMRVRSHTTTRVLLWILVTLVYCGLTNTHLRAQQPSGPQPGATDPMGKPSRLHLFPDDEVFTFSPELPGGQINTRLFRTNTSSNLSLDNAASVQTLPASSNPIVAASGRILTPDQSSVAVVQRDGASSNVRIDILDPKNSVRPQIWNVSALADRSKTLGTDAIAVAVGDLDKATDSQFNYHDEVAVAYLTQDGNIALIVTNYTNTLLGGDIYGRILGTGQLPLDSLIPGDNPLSVAIGDFDNDGNNEVAVALVCNEEIQVTIYRYSNNPQSLSIAKTFTISLPTSENNSPDGGVYGSYMVTPLATISAKAADLNGDGADELAIGFVVGGSAPRISDLPSKWAITTPQIQLLAFDNNLNVTSARQPQVIGTVAVNSSSVQFTKLELATGQFLFNPPDIPFGRQQIVAAWNDQRISAIDVHLLSVSTDLSTINSIGNTVYAKTSPDWPAIPSQQFSLAAGGFVGNSNPSQPTASVAVAAWTPNGGAGVYWIQTITAGSQGLTLAAQAGYATGPPDSLLRAPVVAADWDGKSVYLGAPAHITMESVVSTDYIVEEPPKHSYWDNDTKKVETVTNYDSNNSSFSYAEGATSSSKSTDHSNWTIGGSAEVSAGATVGVSEDAFIAKTDEQASVDVTAKGSYDYNQNKDSYNSSYGSRTFTITSQTDHDDYLQGRLQTIDVWRYRIYGLTLSSPNTNNFYDIMQPGPAVPFSEGGMNFDWYQPVHENGNILTYPQKFNWTDNANNYPADLGSYKDFDGTLKNEPLIPIRQLAFDGTSGSEKLDLSASRGSGGSVDYSNTLAESLDVKASASASIDVGGAKAEARISGNVEFHNSNSWGTATTSDNTTTTDMTISLNKTSGDSSQAYIFDPIVYTATNGTFKMSFAVPNPTSESLNSAGSGFWTRTYSGNPDPALNLPHRFSPHYTLNVLDYWMPNLAQDRKQMRGLFFRKAGVNPVTNDYDFVKDAANDGDQIRIEARIYNESTSQTVTGATASFYSIAYDSSRDNEVCSAPINGDPEDGDGGTGKLCPASARQLIGTASVPILSPLQYTCLSGTDQPAIANCAPSVFINWNTKGLGPKDGTNEYRIYVVLNPGGDEIYGSDGTPVPIQSITGGSPIVVTTQTPHGLNDKEYVTIGQVPGIVGINATYQITWISANSFSLNDTGTLQGTYSGGGTATLLNPGQNDEGYGRFDVGSAASLEAVKGQKLDDFLATDSIRAVDFHTDKLTPENVTAYQNRPLQVRVAVFSSAQHPIGARLLLFDGDPAKGAPAIADQLVHPGNQSTTGTYVWFTWTPTKTGVHQLYAQLVASQNDTKVGVKIASLRVNVLRNGDVNGDGVIDGSDVAELQQNIGKTIKASSCGMAGDLDGDGIISVLDLRRLVLACGAAACKQ